MNDKIKKKSDTKLDSSTITMQVGTRTIEEKAITYHAQASVSEAEFKAKQKKN